MYILRSPSMNKQICSHHRLGPTRIVLTIIMARSYSKFILSMLISRKCASWLSSCICFCVLRYYVKSVGPVIRDALGNRLLEINTEKTWTFSLTNDFVVRRPEVAALLWAACTEHASMLIQETLYMYIYIYIYVDVYYF